MRRKQLADQVAVVMGASSGIGRLTALELAKGGASVVVSARGREALDELVAEIRQAGGRALADPVDLLGYADPSEQPEATGVDKLVLKRRNLFLVGNRLGDMFHAGARDLGLFLTDTRHLSGWRMVVKNGPPLCLSTQVSTDYVSQVDFTVTGLHEGDLLGKEPVNYVHLRRDHGHGFALRGIHLPRHDGRPRFIFRDGEFAQTAARTG